GRDEGSGGARREHAARRRRKPYVALHPVRGGLVQAAGHRLRRRVLRHRRQGPHLHRRAGRPVHDAGRARQGGARGRCGEADEGARVLPQLELPAPEEFGTSRQDKRDSPRGPQQHLLRLLG
ncbi:MAG: Omega-amino acid--pyruvate aminotransferase, partial [uncultured Rubrobacteraceae bacterium]